MVMQNRGPPRGFGDSGRGPPRGFGDSGRRAIYFQGFGEKGYLFSGILGKSIIFGGFKKQRAGGRGKTF